jgi:hypothetical protein
MFMKDILCMPEEVTIVVDNAKIKKMSVHPSQTAQRRTKKESRWASTASRNSLLRSPPERKSFYETDSSSSSSRAPHPIFPSSPHASALRLSWATHKHLVATGGADNSKSGTSRLLPPSQESHLARVQEALELCWDAGAGVGHHGNNGGNAPRTRREFTYTRSLSL